MTVSLISCCYINKLYNFIKFPQKLNPRANPLTMLNAFRCETCPPLAEKGLKEIANFAMSKEQQICLMRKVGQLTFDLLKVVC